MVSDEVHIAVDSMMDGFNQQSYHKAVIAPFVNNISKFFMDD